MISNKSKNNFIRWLKNYPNVSKLAQFDLNYASFATVIDSHIYIIDLDKLTNMENFNYKYYDSIDNLLDDNKSAFMHAVNLPQKIKKIKF